MSIRLHAIRIGPGRDLGRGQRHKSSPEDGPFRAHANGDGVQRPERPVAGPLQSADSRQEWKVQTGRSPPTSA